MRKRKIEEAIVSIVDANQSSNCVEEALNLIDTKSIISIEDTVVITANMVDKKLAQSGTVVHPDMLRKLIRYVKSFNPFRIVVAAGSGGTDTKTVFEQIGFNQIIEDEQVEFIDLNYGPYTEIKLNCNIVPTTKVNELINNTSVHISFTPIKMHKEATVSLGVKNMALSWPPAEIHGTPKKMLGIHEDLHDFIYAMGAVVPIDITLLTGMNGMIGTGPSDGKPVNANMVIAGTDPVATDAVASRLMGFLPQAVQYLNRLYRDGIGEADIKKMCLKGVPIVQAEEMYSLAALGTAISIDKNHLLSVHGD